MSVPQAKAGRRRRHPPRRSLIALHVLAGTGWLAASGALAVGRAESRIARERRVLAAALGARHLGEAALLARWPTRRGMLVGAWIDALHALSMIALAARPAWRGLALTSATGAAGLCAYGVRCALGEQSANARG